MGFFQPEGTMSPQSPPPTFIPPKPSVSYIVDCVYQNTYVWLINGDNFGFTLLAWNMVKYLDIDGTVLSGNSTELTQDL